MNTQGLFRHRAAVIILLVLGILYGGSVPLNLWLGAEMSRRGDFAMSRYCYLGAFWNTLVALLILTAWWMMRQRTRRSLAAGGVAVAVALCVVTRTWVAALITGRSPFPKAEMILICLPILYLVIYALNAVLESGTLPQAAPSPSRLLDEAARMESSDKARAIALYERIIRDFPGTLPASEATRNLEVLKRRDEA